MKAKADVIKSKKYVNPQLPCLPSCIATIDKILLTNTRGPHPRTYCEWSALPLDPGSPHLPHRPRLLARARARERNRDVRLRCANVVYCLQETSVDRKLIKIVVTQPLLPIVAPSTTHPNHQLLKSSGSNGRIETWYLRLPRLQKLVSASVWSISDLEPPCQHLRAHQIFLYRHRQKR